LFDLIARTEQVQASVATRRPVISTFEDVAKGVAGYRLKFTERRDEAHNGEGWGIVRPHSQGHDRFSQRPN